MEETEDSKNETVSDSRTLLADDRLDQLLNELQALRVEVSELSGQKK